MCLQELDPGQYQLGRFVVDHVCHCVVASEHMCACEYLTLCGVTEGVGCKSSPGTAGCKHSCVCVCGGERESMWRNLFFPFRYCVFIVNYPTELHLFAKYWHKMYLYVNI